MTTDLTTSRTKSLTELSESAKTLALKALSENTLHSYTSAISRFRTWLGERQATDTSLTEYCVAQFEQGKSFPVVNQIIAAVAWWCKLTEIPVIQPKREVIAGIRREAHGRGRGQVAGLDWSTVERVLAVAEQHDSPAAKRDCAIVAVMRDCLLRVSECAALTVGAITREADGSGLASVWRSKTRNEQRLYLGESTVQLLDAWLAERGEVDADAPLFVRLHKGGRISNEALSERSIRSIVKMRANNAKIDGRVSGHSLRVGSAQSLVSAGASISEIQQVGNWKSAIMVARYGEGLNAASGAIAKYLHGR